MKKVLGINIDGVIRDNLDRFEKVYIQNFIYNDTLVETTDDMQMKVLTGQEEEAKAEMIQNRVNEMITKPIDSYDLMNHFKFEDGKNYLGIDKTAEEIYDEFVNEIKAFHIFAQAEQFPWAVDSAHRLQQFGKDEELFEVVLFSTLKGKARSATYSFLGTGVGCRIANVKFLEEDFDKWDYCDALIDIVPEAIQSKPEDGLVIKINTEFNKWDEADLSYNSIRDAFQTRDEDGERELLVKLREFFSE